MKKDTFLSKISAYFNIVLLLVVVTALGSCGSIASYKPVPYGKITTDGVMITAEDGSFKLRSGEVWTPPFQNSGINASQSDMVNLYTSALKDGAKKVRVKVPYQSESLYGILALNKVHSEATSAATDPIRFLYR